ncbi:winged helix-turn-helix transcriptional regulator [Oricola sp.]|uniref:winged helix-turn-helix transcriptional regulator n=1 Tax=Oricola sp. TaxID=1979950 RepID=UPI003BACFA42
MTKTRSYKLICPIARALDRIGDRWTLLILRDLHAGPARFSDLQQGLTGIAANLLTDRLAKLVADGLVEKTNGPFGTTLYALTARGQATRSILFELALFGGALPPGPEIVRPGNLRMIAITLGTACQRAMDSEIALEAEFRIDGEPFTLQAGDGNAAMTAGAASDPDIVVTTGYKALLAVSEGEIGLDEFAEGHAELAVNTPGKEVQLMQLLSGAIAVLHGDAA